VLRFAGIVEIGYRLLFLNSSSVFQLQPTRELRLLLHFE
jgi:hypothetical protein